MTFKSKVYSFVVLLIYGLVTLLWFTFFLYTGEGNSTDSIETFAFVNKFTFYYLLILLCYFLFSKQVFVRTLLLRAGAFVSVLLFAGFVGVVCSTEPAPTLAMFRLLTCIANVIIYLIGYKKNNFVI